MQGSARAQDVPGVTGNEIRIGSFGAFAGQGYLFGRLTMDGIEAVFHKVNAEGGINGRNLVLIREDDRCDPKAAVTAIRTLVSVHKVFALLGGGCSNATLAARSEIERAQIPFNDVASVADAISQPVSKYIYTTQLTATIESVAQLQYAIDHGAKKIAVVAQPDAWGKAGYDPLVADFKKRNLSPVVDLQIGPEDQDASQQALTIAEAGADAVLLVLYPKPATAVTRGLAKLGYKPMLIGQTAINPLALANEVGVPGAADRYVTPAAVRHLPSDPEMKEWTTLLKNLFPHEEPSSFNLMGIGAAQVMVAALKAAGPDLTREKYLAAMAMTESPEMLDMIFHDDGTQLPGADVEHIFDVLVNAEIPIKCHKGDVALLNNIIAMHGRRPYRALRSILVGMIRKHEAVDRLRPEQLKGVDLSGWKVAFNGAEPVRAETLQRFAANFAAYGFHARALYPCYGMAEATLLISGGEPGAGSRLWPVDRDALQQHRVVPAPSTAARRQQLVGCGKVLVGERIAIVDPVEYVRLGPGRVGEIWVHGPNVTQGYWQQPEASERTFRARIAGEEDVCWLRTGDLGCLDRAGELYITGRIKDVIIVRGVNHYPQDIERTVERSHLALRRHCGAAFTILRDGQEHLVVVQEIDRTSRHSLDIDAIQTAIRMAVVAEHELTIHDIVLIRTGTIPKTTSGKIRRSLTRDLWQTGELEAYGDEDHRLIKQRAIGSMRESGAVEPDPASVQGA